MAVSSLTVDLKNTGLLLSFPGSGVMRGLEGPHLRAAIQMSGVGVGGGGGCRVLPEDVSSSSPRG